MLRQTRPRISDGAEEQRCLAIGMRASSQQAVHGQDIPAIGAVQEVMAVGTGTPHRHIGGMTVTPRPSCTGPGGWAANWSKKPACTPVAMMYTAWNLRTPLSFLLAMYA